MSIEVLNETDADVDELELVACARYVLGEMKVHPQAELAISLTKGDKPKGDTTVDTAGGASIQSFLLTPVAVTVDNIESTVVKDEFYGTDSASKICTADFQAACEKYGIK